MISFPSRLTKGIEAFLHHKLIDLKKKEKSLKENDPFSDVHRTGNNSLEEDVDEQIGRFETEVKISFIKKQIIITLNNKQTHTFDYGMLNIDDIVDAINL